ncbi:MAG: hybrid sensor histidine kinase/response regulator [Phycisphaerae bacterium]
MDSLLSRFRPEAKSKGLQLFTEVSPDSSVTGDRELTALVLQNLLGNAIKYTGHGAVRLLATRRPDGEWNIAVTDDGPGIAEEDQARLFNAFVRGNTHGQPGAGLGLSIASQAANLLGGSLTVHSIVGVGSTFTLTLPARSRLPESEHPEPPAAPPAKPLRILLVEDIPETARAMVRLLTSMGHTVVAVSSADAALRAAADQSFDVLLSDIGLQGKSGLDLMRELRQLRPNLPGIALTGYGTGADERRSTDAGFSRHLTKPVDPKALDHALRNIQP